ncbi:hypothetical protein B0H13DRAFT_1851430 [Mycena leptocephala]|nr:hypothetical protein B0H13DRAFT_1851430 [Mycena leptocephala]
MADTLEPLKVDLFRVWVAPQFVNSSRTLDLEYKHNKEFRELNAQVRDKAGMGGKRKREAGAVVLKASKSKSTAGSTKANAEPTANKKPRDKEANNPMETAAKPTKQTAKKTTRAAEEHWMDVDVEPDKTSHEADRAEDNKSCRILKYFKKNVARSTFYQSLVMVEENVEMGANVTHGVQECCKNVILTFIQALGRVWSPIDSVLTGGRIIEHNRLYNN